MREMHVNVHACQDLTREYESTAATAQAQHCLGFVGHNGNLQARRSLCKDSAWLGNLQ